MPKIEEWIKGASVFVILSMLTYFAYDTIITGTLDWVQSTNSIMGAIGWVGFVALYLICCPLYMFYCIIAGANGDSTDPKWILAGYSSFFLFLIIATFINLIFGGFDATFGGGTNSTGIIDAINQSTYSTIGDTSDLVKISWGAVLVAILGVIGAPFVMILKGYGKLDKILEKVNTGG